MLLVIAASAPDYLPQRGTTMKAIMHVGLAG